MFLVRLLPLLLLVATTDQTRCEESIRRGEYDGSSSLCTPTNPPVWEPRFYMKQRKKQENSFSTVDFYFDSLRGASLIVDTPDANLSDPLWDLELSNHSSYYFHPNRSTCDVIEMPVGLLALNWLENATYLGAFHINGKDCYGYTKEDFIDYYADKSTCLPVRWYFHSMQATFDTVSYVSNRSVRDLSWLAVPAICEGQNSTRRPAPPR